MKRASAISHMSSKIEAEVSKRIIFAGVSMNLWVAG